MQNAVTRNRVWSVQPRLWRRFRPKFCQALFVWKFFAWTPELELLRRNDERSMLARFALEYGRYHGYVSVVVCVLGIVCSCLVVAVLTRRHMLTSSNYMLTALAICDLITMLSYIPYAIQFYCLYGVRKSVERNTLGSAWFCIVHANLSVTAHTASIWITVALSAFRYSMVRRAADGRAATSAAAAGCDLRTSRWIVLLVCASSAVVLIPNYLSLSIATIADPLTNGNENSTQTRRSHFWQDVNASRVERLSRHSVGHLGG